MRLLPMVLLSAFYAVSGYIYLALREYDSAREWSVLQALELRSRSQDLSQKVVIENDKDFGEAIGIISIDGKQRVWILARSASGERLKLIPKAGEAGGTRIRITESEYKEISGRVQLSDEVERFLMNAIYLTSEAN
jgi:hypothetical protein